MRTGTRSIASASVSVHSQRASSPCVSAPMEGNEGEDRYCVHDSFCFTEVLHHLPISLNAVLSVVLAAVGSLALMPLWLRMGHLWTTDPLRSIGAVFPLVACAGVLAAWRRLGWSTRGTFWGLPVVALSILLARAIDSSALIVSYDGLHPMNYGTALFLYACGTVLFFGGPRLLRNSILPLCLLLLINPVPTAFNARVDLPLQYLSASTARSFAHLIGVQPTGVQLRMMFTPDFGMFIAPGCNGVRGSITLFYLALIFGYVHRLRLHMLVLIALGAFILGYALNLLRLCVLVVYYRIGTSFPAIQKHGSGIDYVIGSTLFLLVALGLGMLIYSLEPSRESDTQEARRKLAVEDPRFSGPVLPSRVTAIVRALCFFALTSAFVVPELRSTCLPQALRPTEQKVLSSYPATVGPYRLTRTWAEHDNNGKICLAMAEYVASPDSGGTAKRFTLGLWVGSAHHLVADSKFFQGIRAQWTGSFNATARHALPVHFDTSFYDDGISRQYDAESICRHSGCAGRHRILSQKGFSLTTSGLFDLASATHGKSVPILLRREWLDSDPTPSADLRVQFDTDARIFMSQVDLQPLLGQDGY
jgi:exosortase J